MEISTDFRELQRAADYKVVQKILVGGGFASIVFGLLAIWMGLSSYEEHWLNGILGLIGIILFVEGIWILMSPGARGLLAEGSVFLLLGLWNLLIAVLSVASVPEEPPVYLFVIAGVQLFWAGQCLRYYRRYKDSDLSKPPIEYRDWLKDVLNIIKGGKPKKDPDIVQLTEGGKIWKGHLLHDGAVFVKQAGQDIVVCPKHLASFEWRKRGKRNSTVALSFEGHLITGKMRTDQAERLEAWKSAAEPETADAIDASAEAESGPRPPLEA